MEALVGLLLLVGGGFVLAVQHRRRRAPAPGPLSLPAGVLGPPSLRGPGLIGPGPHAVGPNTAGSHATGPHASSTIPPTTADEPVWVSPSPEARDLAPAGAGPHHLLAFADPGANHAGHGYQHRGDYGVISMLTTGWSPTKDAILELAVVRTDHAGIIRDEFDTVLDPGSVDHGLAQWHGLDREFTGNAPQFAQVAEALRARLAGAVVVSYLPDLDEQFLASAFLTCRVLPAPMPALDACLLAQRTFAIPNVRLRSLAAHLPGTHPPLDSALGRARLMATALAPMLARHGSQLAFPIAPPPPVAHIPPSPALPRPTRSTPEPGHPWLQQLMVALPMSAREAHDGRTAAYLDAVTTALGRGSIVTADIRLLTSQFAKSGVATSEIHSVIQRLLESIRRAAFALPRLSDAHVRHLRATATSLGVPTYFDDLVTPPQPEAPVPGSGSFARPVRKPPPAPPPSRLPRCGRCLSVGHYAAACPRPAALTNPIITPVGPIARIGGVQPL